MLYRFTARFAVANILRQLQGGFRTGNGLLLVAAAESRRRPHSGAVIEAVRIRIELVFCQDDPRTLSEVVVVDLAQY